MTSNSDSDCSGIYTPGPSTSSRSKKWRKQKFYNNWLNLPEFKGWLEEIPENPYNCRCKACNCQLTCGKSELLKHAKGKKHQEKVKLIASNSNLLRTFVETIQIDENRKAQQFELRLSAFFAEHNVAFQVIDHLVPLLKEILPDSEILKNVTLGRQKCTNIIKNVLAPTLNEDLVKILRVTKFSILIDESTDITSNKTMCVVVRYVNPDNGEVATKLLELLKLNPIDCSAEELYKAFKGLLEKYDIPITNVIGMASDGASVMVGIQNSFASRLLKDCNKATVIKCMCHTSAIIANKACMQLPRAPEELLRQIYTYLSGSAKRCSQLEEMQEFFNTGKKKILRVAGTRWLSLQRCVERVLENWEVLKGYFRVAVVDDKLKSAEVILKELENLCTKAYLIFLKYVLNYFNSINALFQSKKPLVHELYSESKKLFFKLGQNFIKPDKLTLSVNTRCPHNYLPIEEIYLGNECNEVLLEISDSSAVKQIKLDCLNFYITSLEEMQNRLPINQNDNIFQSFEFLKPEIALNKDRQIRNINFKLLTHHFGMNSLESDGIREEWNTIALLLDEKKTNLIQESMEQFWYSVSKMKDFDEKLLFPNLSKLSKLVITLPHANADSERIFSVVTDIRTKKRNKIGHEALEAICIIRSYFSDLKTDCVNYKWKTDSNTIYDKMRAVHLYKHKNKN